MGIRRYETEFTVPAGTAIIAPFTQQVALEDNQLDSVRIVVPDGHAGLTGLRIVWSGTQKFPYNTGAWFIANGESLEIPYAEEITESGLSLTGYNLDVYQHIFFLRWQVSDLPTAPPVDISSPQAAGANNAITTTDITNLTGGDTSNLCFDINGNVVDCGDPAAVTGPVTAGPPPPLTLVPPIAVGVLAHPGPPSTGVISIPPIPPPAGPQPHRPPPPIRTHPPTPARPPTGHTEPPGRHAGGPLADRPRTGGHAAAPPGRDGRRPITARPLPPPPEPTSREG